MGKQRNDRMTFRLTINTVPGAEPISTAEAKTHCRVDGSDDDTYIGTLIVAARRRAEHYLSRALITQTWNMYLDRFPQTIVVPRPPLQSATITYVDVDGATQTLATGIYTVDTDAEPGLIYQAYDQDWPSTRDVEKAVKVTFVAGYGAASTDIPQDILHAMKLHIGHLYEHREQVTDLKSEILPMGYEDLMYDYRIKLF